MPYVHPTRLNPECTCCIGENVSMHTRVDEGLQVYSCYSCSSVQYVAIVYSQVAGYNLAWHNVTLVTWTPLMLTAKVICELCPFITYQTSPSTENIST